jgi:hypothetical protein
VHNHDVVIVVGILTVGTTERARKKKLSAHVEEGVVVVGSGVAGRGFGVGGAPNT